MRLFLAATLLLLSPAAASAQPAPNDDIATPTTVTGLPFWDSTYASEASLHPDEPAACLGAPTPGTHGASVWYRFDPATDLDIRFHARLWENYVFTWTIGDGVSLGLFEATPAGPDLIACSGGASADGRGPRIDHRSLGGRTYLVQVACRCAPRPFTQLELGVNAIPPNDHLDGATVVTSLPFEDEIHMNWATLQPDEPRGCLSAWPASFSSVWYRITPDVDATYVAAAGRNHGGPSIGIFRDGPSGPVLERCWTAGTEPEGGGNTDWTLARFDAAAGQSYLIQVVQDGYDLNLEIPSAFDLREVDALDTAITTVRATPGAGRVAVEFDHAGPARFRWMVSACPIGGSEPCQTITTGFERNQTQGGTVKVEPLVGACVGEFEIHATASDEIYNADPNPANDSASTTVSFTPPLTGVGVGPCGFGG